MNRRRIEALRALAERPGTVAEGELAREMLARAEKSQPKRSRTEAFSAYLKSHSIEDLEESCGPNLCACGALRPFFESCMDSFRHQAIAGEIRKRFPKGTRVYYNYWDYSRNDPGVVTEYPCTWNWLRIKFDRLKAARSVPIYSPKGWHLSVAPVDQETLDQTGLCGFTKAEQDAIDRDVANMVNR